MKNTVGKCPLCGADVVEQNRSFSCIRGTDSGKGCSFRLWKIVCGKRVNSRTAKKLLESGETSLLRGFRSKAGRAFSARLVLKHGLVSFDFPKRKAA